MFALTFFLRNEALENVFLFHHKCTSFAGNYILKSLGSKTDNVNIRNK